MNFTVSSSQLSSRLQIISKVISSKNPIQVLECVLFELHGNTLTLTASSADNSLNTSFEVVESSEDFSFVISAKILIDSLKEISEQPLRFEINKDTLEVNILYLNGKYSMVAFSADEYPTPVVLDEDAIKMALPACLLANGISCSLFATAGEEADRRFMSCVYFDFTPENITIVATDGHKLARYRDSSVTGVEKSAFLLPKKPAALLKGLLDKEEEDVTVEFDGRFAIFTMGEYRLVARRYDGRYPNYNSVIPQNNPHKLLVDRIALISALRRVALFSSAAVSLVKLHIEDNKIIVSAQDTDFSTSAEESVTCEYGGVPMNIGFRAMFLIDILSNISGENVVFELADPSRAGVIVPAEQTDQQELLMLLMPMMLTD